MGKSELKVIWAEGGFGPNISDLRGLVLSLYLVLAVFLNPVCALDSSSELKKEGKEDCWALYQIII